MLLKVNLLHWIRLFSEFSLVAEPEEHEDAAAAASTSTAAGTQDSPSDSEPEIEPEQQDSPRAIVSTPDDLQNDVGRFIDATKSSAEINDIIAAMTDGQKYHLLRHHDQPSRHHIFPTQRIGGCERSFRYAWLEETGWWLVYSSCLDGAFCICCSLFAPSAERSKMGVMVNYPFIKWHHKSDVVGKHAVKPSHQRAMQAAAVFLQSIDQPQTATPC